MNKPIDKKMVAPCGMVCSFCLHYLRAENKCPGCSTGRKVNNKPIKCSRRLCKERKGAFCFECDSFPCASLNKLDERYRQRYGMSEIENLEFIRDHGIGNFIEQQQNKYCRESEIYCVHDYKWYKQ